MTAGEQPKLRRDAERNRERILVAARTVFRAEGVHASMASVAREAGVGIATLFRRFPTKEGLLAEVFADRMAAYARAVKIALEDEDPWRGLVAFVETVSSMQAADFGFADVLTMIFPADRSAQEQRDEVFCDVVDLLDRAKAAGRLREDVTPEDLVLLQIANAGVVNATGVAAPDAWRRVVAMMLQAYQAPARGSLPAAPEADALYRAMASARVTSPVDDRG